ncbi:MAG: DMT family transporter [Methylotetracoccus sp.]
MHWLSLSILCAFSLATADAFSKRYFQRFRDDELVISRFAYSAVALLPWIVYEPPTMPAGPFWLWVGVAIPLEVGAMLLYMRAVRDCPLSLSQPMLAFTPVFTVPVAALLLGEAVSLTGMIGIALVVAGTLLLNLGSMDRDARVIRSLIPALMTQSGTRLMLAVSLIYGVTSVLGKGALAYMPAARFGPFYFVLVSLFSMVFLTGRRPASIVCLRYRPSLQLLVGMLMAVMIYTHFLALDQVQSSYMIAAKRSSILFSVIYGSLCFHEGRLVQRLIAAIIMLAGVGLLAVSPVGS